MDSKATCPQCNGAIVAGTKDGDTWENCPNQPQHYCYYSSANNHIVSFMSTDGTKAVKMEWSKTLDTATHDALVAAMNAAMTSIIGA